MRVRQLVLISAAALAVSGCAAPIIGALTLGQLTTIAGLVSTVTTGKGLTDHALSFLTGKNCDIAEGILRKDRLICEPRGSAATQEDFKGVFAYFEKKNHEGEPGDKALERYAAARSDELAQAQDDKNAAPVAVTEANATSLNLRRLSFFDDIQTMPDTGAQPAPAPVMLADASTSSQVKLITYRDTDRDGTPRIVSRYVYMMTPIADSPSEPAVATATAAPAAPATPAPVATPAAPPAPTAPVVAAVQSQPEVAPAKPVPTIAKAEPVRYQPSVKKAAAAPQPLVHWYLSGR